MEKNLFCIRCNYLWRGINITDRGKILTCPDCGEQYRITTYKGEGRDKEIPEEPSLSLYFVDYVIMDNAGKEYKIFPLSRLCSFDKAQKFIREILKPANKDLSFYIVNKEDGTIFNQ